MSFLYKWLQMSQQCQILTSADSCVWKIAWLSSDCPLQDHHTGPLMSGSSTVDLANQYVLPSHIVSTNIRPNTVWWNNKLQSVCMVELTVYHDTLFNEAVPQKKDKYLDLV